MSYFFIFLINFYCPTEKNLSGSFCGFQIRNWFLFFYFSPGFSFVTFSPRWLRVPTSIHSTPSPTFIPNKTKLILSIRYHRNDEYIECCPQPRWNTVKLDKSRIFELSSGSPRLHRPSVCIQTGKRAYNVDRYKVVNKWIHLKNNIKSLTTWKVNTKNWYQMGGGGHITIFITSFIWFIPPQLK